MDFYFHLPFRKFATTDMTAQNHCLGGSILCQKMKATEIILLASAWSDRCCPKTKGSPPEDYMVTYRDVSGPPTFCCENSRYVAGALRVRQACASVSPHLGALPNLLMILFHLQIVYYTRNYLDRIGRE